MDFQKTLRVFNTQCIMTANNKKIPLALCVMTAKIILSRFLKHLYLLLARSPFLDGVQQIFTASWSRKYFRGYFLDELRNFITDVPFFKTSIDSPTEKTLIKKYALNYRSGISIKKVVSRVVWKTQVK